MATLAHLLKYSRIRATIVAPLVFCAFSSLHAAVMEFPGDSLSSTSSIGLEKRSDKVLDDLRLDAEPNSGYGPSGEANLLPELNSKSRTDEVVNSVLGVSNSGNWLEDTREAELAEPANALTLMKAYVNILDNSKSANSAGNSGRNGTSRGNGQGFLMSMAKGLDDAETLNIITQVMQPHVENDLVSFSVLGFGQFMIIGEPDGGNLSIMNLNNGQQLGLHGQSPDRYGIGRDDAASRSADDSAGFIPNEEENLAQLVLLLLAILTNPMFILTTACIFSIWVVYRLAKRFS